MLFGRWRWVNSYLELDPVLFPLACLESSPDFTLLDLLAGEFWSGISSMFRLALFLEVFGDCEGTSRALDALPRVPRTGMPENVYRSLKRFNRQLSFPSAFAISQHKKSNTIEEETWNGQWRLIWVSKAVRHRPIHRL